MIHTTVGIYPNGDYKINGVCSENLAEHIKYNIQYRPGRILLVDGHCIHDGMMGLEVGQKAEQQFGDCERNLDTAPYV